MLQYLHPAYAPQMAMYQLATEASQSGMDSLEKVDESRPSAIPNESEPEALLLRHQDSEKVVCYDPSVWLSTGPFRRSMLPREAE
ncbi:unnamed protein product [Protopolystoma xenopodis]|uniref:Uncharacterized protein n=1 Tax=Protopolystoma xenopodis TaxID=117903 RepID=A0A448X2W4_9PLAT|nr:unnamed protein product [Protopolystoma xenopodis]